MTTAPAALRLPRLLTHDLASSATAAAAETVQSSGAGPLTVDASALEQFDSSALAVLLEYRRQALSAGRLLIVTGAPQRLVQLATLYGVAELISGTSASFVRTS